MNVELEMTENELKQFEKDMERFSVIQKENNFKTIWCIDEIENLNETSFISADYITDGVNDIKVELPNKELTWLELWAAADTLYRNIGNTEHFFIEEFKVIQNGDKTEVQVFFGS